MLLKKIVLVSLGLSGLFFVTFSPASQSEGSYQQGELSFTTYLDGLKQQGREAGVSEKTLNIAFSQMKLFKKAVINDENKALPEKFAEYLPESVPETLVEQSRALFKAHKEEFERLGKQYGVQPRFVLALWGLTSHLGEDVGDYPALSVIASNGYGAKRNALDRIDFIAGLKWLDRSKAEFNQLRSNWKGELGYPHFSVEEFARYGVDGNQDGQIDIWQDLHDAFASTANYLSQQGWDEKSTWGRQVQVPANIDSELSGLEIHKTFDEWQAIGVRRFDGSDLPNRSDMQVSLIMPDGVNGRKYLVYDNYRILSQRYASAYFVLSLTYLSERIKYPEIQ
ncbi:lytic murein transglycosylase [Shewanella sp. AS1]|uniref:lytic murein transglycosylase n=1 Tax=Shewanella sp. AS1 TaxID=2907626 RepID=UPI001F2207D7|nr:lytic murein transglycosylase [Shewanella sp. AS1]MCE9678596.1 lytic murein transglycosylase [Shewanella sp. AS1]